MNIRKILIGIDNSKYAEKAAEYGFFLARTFKAEVGLVHIVEPMAIAEMPDDTLMTGGIGLTPAADTSELLEIQTEQSENMIAHTIKQLAGDLAVAHFTEYGSTANGIIDCSKSFNADLIVIGTHARSGLDRLLEGSVAEHVVRYSEVPVVVVPFVEKG